MKCSLFIIVLICVLFTNSIKASLLYCSNSELCRLINIVTHQKIKTQTLVVIGGDPHEFEPTSEEVKELLTKSPLVIGPTELHPWLKKVIYQRAKNPSLITFSLNFKPEILNIYKGASKEALSHFWLYPNIYCQFKNDLKNWNWLKDQKIDLSSDCDLSKIENKMISKLKLMNKPIILSHDALLPLFTFYGKSAASQTISLKGSGHHDEVSPTSVKTLYKLMEKNKLIWILENNIAIPSNITSKIRKDDIIIKIDTSKSLNESDDFSILNALFDEFK